MTPKPMTAEERADKIVESFNGKTFSSSIEFSDWLKNQITTHIEAAERDAAEAMREMAAKSLKSIGYDDNSVAVTYIRALPLPSQKPNRFVRVNKRKSKGE